MLRSPPQPMWDLTIHPPKRAQRPRWHIDSEPTLIPSVTVQPLARYCPLWSVGMMDNRPPTLTQPHGFVSDNRDDGLSPPHSLVKTRHARERYPHPYKACFVLLPNRSRGDQSEAAGRRRRPPAAGGRGRTAGRGQRQPALRSPDINRLSREVHVVGHRTSK
ncbi:hypothetical protein PIB30_039081 [Stylosanthes scabra]|uniref:Uncharacterized protein n=1 Tax=Stylosanthes scabra TaxID=79078 RepID=A0ABU6XDU3_9FABA|nr:hypothetical protein [Stylosanthes scabra]